MESGSQAARSLSNKVFGLGLARTGTTSLHEAMGMLGLVSAPNSVPLLDSIDLDFLKHYDSFFDNPIPFRYHALDTVCPNSKWIVTQRPIDEWLASMEWLFGPGIDRLAPEIRLVGDRVHRQVYGSARFDETRLRALYTRHYDDLASWIVDRDAVWMHLDQGLTWQPICDLLEVPVPAADFPHSNGRRRVRRQLRRTARNK